MAQMQDTNVLVILGININASNSVAINARADFDVFFLKVLACSDHQDSCMESCLPLMLIWNDNRLR